MPSSIKVALLDSENTVATLSNNQPIVLEFNTPDTHVTGTSTHASLLKLGWVPLLVRVQVSSGSTPVSNFYFTRRSFSYSKYELLGTFPSSLSYSVAVGDDGASIRADLSGAGSGYTISGMWGYNYVMPVSESFSTILTNSDHTAIIPFHGPGVEYGKNYRYCYMSVPLPIFDSSTQLSVNAANSFCTEQAASGDVLSPVVVLGVAMADWDTGAYPTRANLLTDTNRTNVLRKDASNILQVDGITVSATGLTWDPTHYGFLYAAASAPGKIYNQFLLSDGWYGSKDVSRQAVNGSYNDAERVSPSYFFATTFEQWAYYDGSTITRE